MATLRIYFKLTWFVYLLIVGSVVYHLSSSDAPDPAHLLTTAVLALVVTPLVTSGVIRRYRPKYGRAPENWPHFFSWKGFVVEGGDGPAPGGQ